MADTAMRQLRLAWHCPARSPSLALSSTASPILLSRVLCHEQQRDPSPLPRAGSPKPWHSSLYRNGHLRDPHHTASRIKPQRASDFGLAPLRLPSYHYALFARQISERVEVRLKLSPIITLAIPFQNDHSSTLRPRRAAPTSYAPFSVIRLALP